MNTPSRILFILGWATVLSIGLKAEQRLCSAGERDGQVCQGAQDCPGGACVVSQGVCDGGLDDGFDCDCPESSCTAAPVCPEDPELGTCAGGSNEGTCCDLAFNCRSAAPCRGTQKICFSGSLKGFPCLRDGHCPASVCWATGRTCSENGLPCVDDADCLVGSCQGEGSFPPPTPTPSPPNCAGDCDGDGEVTIDNLLVLVNIALDQAPLTSCSAGDLNGDRSITIDEIVAAVGAALSGCPTNSGTS